MNIPAVEDGAVGTVRRIILRRQAYRRADFFSCAWAARQGIPWGAVDDPRRTF